MRIKLITMLALPGCLVATPSGAKAPIPAPETTLSYADSADLALAAPLVAEVRVNKVKRIDTKAMPMPAGTRRYLVNATVTALIRGSGGIEPTISYLADARSDSLGRFASWKKARMMIFALPVANRPAEVRLAAPDAQQLLTPDLSTRARGILAEALAPGAPPRVLRVGDAFHVPGAVPGEGETQIFLGADDGRPLSLSVWRSQGEPPKWSVSLGEIVDEGAAPPRRDSLLWYRLACFLPATLPPASTDSLEADAAQIARDDYATVIAGLGTCPRTRR
jgi:hypothetical protein